MLELKLEVITWGSLGEWVASYRVPADVFSSQSLLLSSASALEEIVGRRPLALLGRV